MDTYKLEYKKKHIGIPKIVVKMYNSSRNQADKLCDVHHAQLTRHYFVEYVESLYRTPKTRPCSPQFICLQQKRRMNMRMRTKIVAMILVIALALSLSGCGSSGGSSDGKISLTFQIWDVAPDL